MTSTRRALTASAIALLVSAMCSCKPNPADCYEKGDEKACNRLCETGAEQYLATCYEMRARVVEACVDGGGDCEKACALWRLAGPDDLSRKVYVGKLASAKRVKAMEKKCAGGADE